ncbi:ABC transporter ATP-binding protein [Microbacterium hominis]|uniref:ABC transporter ATP-binding protein n=1 Tax=Microbacterium hominis TaxID=162426 RepID=A0A7D4Q504_9MICO|nr:ABC transporter ATP-binding protein [Microbacterium hominis]
MDAPATDAAVAVVDLRKRYGRHVGLDGVTLSIPRGTVFGLIGPNGAGKTTTLRLLLDIIRPTSGTARVLGIDPRSGGPALRRRIGYLPGELRLEGRVTGRRLLEFYARVSGPMAPGRIAELAERLDLDLGRPVRTLSKGNKQKVGLVQAFMHEPELLVLDEPTSGLDPLVQREVHALIREARDAGRTVLLSSHVLSEVEHAADEVAVLAGGRIVAQGDVGSLRVRAVRRVRAGVGDVDAAQVRSLLAAVPGIRDLEVAEHSGAVRVVAELEGDINGLVAVLATMRLTDLELVEPDLEESVLRLYGDTSGEDADA